MEDTKGGLALLLTELKFKNKLPKNIDISKIGDRYWCVCYDEDNSEIISESSTTGFAESSDVALLKALSERAERRAFRTGHMRKLSSCMTERSDGFAAYPLFYRNAEVSARNSALSEAIERYAWAQWWDDEEIAFTIEPIDSFANKHNILMNVSSVKEACGLDEILVISPHIENSNNQVVILLGQLKTGGYISGGACDLINNFKLVLLRSLDELYRHGLAVKKIIYENLEPTTFYEKRLVYFAFGHGNELVAKRIKAQGKKSITLPRLEIDELVPHDLGDLFQVHRCYFENQPIFVGGALERLCL